MLNTLQSGIHSVGSIISDASVFNNACYIHISLTLILSTKYVVFIVSRLKSSFLNSLDGWKSAV